MEGTFKRLLLAVVMLMGLALWAGAQEVPDLSPYLQRELNAITVLNAQVNSFQQSGSDSLLSATLASYIPDHMMQANMLRNTMTAVGQNPAGVTANVTDIYTGTAGNVVEHDVDSYRDIADRYQNLLEDTDNPAVLRTAYNGLNVAERHLNSLYVARSTVDPSESHTRDALLAQLTLERAVIADLQVQAGQLRVLGDISNANILLSSIPAHQQQVARLIPLVTQAGGDPALAVAPLAVPFATQNDILMHERVLGIQMANTYAMPIAALPQGPVRQVQQLGQLNYLTMLARLPQPVIVV